ncbi:MAG: hypothetical protein ACKVOQ_01695 [Cyclobacteriaceae bacterium]
MKLEIYIQPHRHIEYIAEKRRQNYVPYVPMWLMFGFLFLTHSQVNSQAPLKKIKEIKSSEVVLATVDRLGDFFLVTKNGTIKKYDPQGKVMASLKEKNTTLLEPWYHPSIFTYDKKKQSYATYGRNFENEKQTAVEPAWAIEPSLVCPSNDNKLWLFDQADASLKKVNPFTNEVLIEFNLDTIKFKTKPDFTHLREYQSMIFLLDKNSGIVILNNIGKQINKIEQAGIGNFNFFGEELYYLDGSSIKLFDLYTEEIREIKIEGENKFALVTDERIILVSRKNGVTVYEFKPL